MESVNGQMRLLAIWNWRTEENSMMRGFVNFVNKHL
jgi:hypothetical protein